VTRHPLIWIICGFTLWSLLFVALYGVQATGCHLGFERIGVIAGLSALRMVMLLLLGGGLLAFVLIFRLANKRQSFGGDASTSSFFREVGTYVWVAAFLAIPLCFAGVGMLTLCAT
jgi:hypothetical protein